MLNEKSERFNFLNCIQLKIMIGRKLELGTITVIPICIVRTILQRQFISRVFILLNTL